MLERLVFYTRHSLNDLRVNRQRTLFALLCIAVGVAAIVGLQTLGVMITDTLTSSLQESNGGDIQINAQAGRDVPREVIRLGKDQGVIKAVGGAGMGRNRDTTSFSPAGLEQIQTWFDANYPGAETTYRYSFGGSGHGSRAEGMISNLRTGTEQALIAPYIVDAGAYPLYGERLSEDGRPLSELLQNPTDIVISRNLADTLGAQVGDTLRMSDASQDFSVRGIVPTDAEGGLENMFGALFGYYYVDQSAVDLFDGAQPMADRIFVRLADPSQVEAVNAAFGEQFPYLSTDTTADLEAENSLVSDTVNDLVTVMGLVSLLIGGIGIVNTMQVIVSRRTTEVAVLKTVGLEGEQVTVLFMVEAVLMGVLGGLIGIALGWLAAYLLKGVAGVFLAQSLTFRITPAPALTGFVVGVIVTAIFGFMPTLAAGQVRPNLVLRPRDTVVPQAGRSRSLAALLVVLLALSAVVQPLFGDLLAFEGTLLLIAQGVGAFIGVLMGVTLVTGGVFSERTRGNGLLQALRPVVLLAGLPVLGLLFARVFPAVLILLGVFVIVGVLYVALWALIWLVGRFFPTWHLVDLKIALRSMLATRGRGASTLLALVIGVFTLSLLTMLTSAISAQFSKMLVDQAGGNVIVMTAGQGNALEHVQTRLAEIEGVTSSTVIGSYAVELVSLYDVSENVIVPYQELNARVETGSSAGMGMGAHAPRLRRAMSSIDGRGVDSNLPEVSLYKGRQLTAADAGQPYMVIPADATTLAAGFDVGDQLTLRLSRAGEPELTFEIVGMVDQVGGGISMEITSQNYVPIDAFPAEFAPDSVKAIVEVEEDQIAALRRAVNDIPGAFVMEARLVNDLINRIVAQFTSFPILVAALALFTGGVVIANSVALSTMERRREIGIMKAIGLQRERVLGTLLLEYGLMGLIGGLIGVGIGGIILVLLLAMVFGGIGSAFPYLTALGLLGLCVAIALLAAFVTAWGASGEKPLNVLRYE